MSIRTTKDTQGLLKKLYGYNYDVLSIPNTDGKLTDRELNSLFDRSVSYANPLVPTKHSYKDRIMESVRNVYTSVARKLNEYGIPLIRPPKQVAVVDAFDVELNPTIIPTNDGGYLFTILPGGNASAFYTNDDNEALAISEIAIPGTERNKSARNLYTAGREIVDHILKRYSVPKRVKDSLRGTRDFYNSMITRLGSEYDLVRTATHEMYHHALRVLGISYDVRGEKNEGLTEKLTEEHLGTSSIPGTTYDGFRRRIGDSIRKIGRRFRNGVSSAFDFVRNYRPEHGRELATI